MGALKDRLPLELREAMKARDRTRLATLRLLTAAVRNREVELGHDLSDEELQAVASTEVKRRREAAEAYEQGGRPELAQQERAEQAILETYLPEQLSDEELDAIIDEAVAATGASGPGDVGRVMGQVMGKAKGRADGNEVRRRVAQRLGG
ncbi:MAG TPA: GatB/YqeY domain-containing protein [Actinomycetota bacterium]|nr:GatB/YqeY domain-containing protein [Actinomycetota bacterium]